MDYKQMLFMFIQSGAVGSLLMPPLISFITRVAWPKHVKAMVAIVTSVFFGALMAWVQGSLSGLSATSKLQLIIIAAPTVAAASHKAYEQFWKGSDIADWIEMRWNVGPLAGLPEPARQRVAQFNRGRVIKGSGVPVKPKTFEE